MSCASVIAVAACFFVSNNFSSHFVTPALAGDGIVIIDVSKNKKIGSSSKKTGHEFRVGFRTGVHQDYDRLVLEGKRFTKRDVVIDRRDKKLVIRFEKEGVLSQPSFVFKRMKHIESIAQVSSSPLQVEVKAHTDNIKTQYLKNKVVLDFYAPSDKEIKQSQDEKQTPVSNLSIQKQIKEQELPLKVKAVAPEAVVTSSLNEVVEPEISESLESTVESRERVSRMKRLKQIRQRGAEAETYSYNEALRDGSVVSISSLTPLELAVFKRDGYLWIVQSAKRQGLPPLVDGPVKVKPTLVNDKYNKVEAWVLPIDSDVSYSVDSTEFAWKVNISKKVPPLKETLPFLYDEVLHRGEKKNALILDLNQVSSGYEFNDPYIGDSFVAFPVNQSRYQVNRAQKFPQFEFIPAKAGIAMKFYAPDLDYFYRDGRLHITSDKEFMVSSPAVALQSTPIAFAKGKAGESKSFFDVSSWFVTGPYSFTKDRRLFERQIVEAPTDDVRLNNVLNLAKLYFANGFGHEGIGVLKTAKLMDPRLSDNHNFLALEGVMLSLSDRHSEAFPRLYDPRIAQYPEMALWRGYSHARKGNWKEAYEEFSKTGDVIEGYPRVLQAKLLPVLIESCLQSGDRVNSVFLIDLLEKGKDLHRKELSILSYFKGRIAMLEGDYLGAVHHLHLAANGADRYYRARAAFEMLKLQRANDDISNEKAIDVLERIRFIWRGDELEVSVMEYLSEIYYLEKKYADSLKMLKRILPLVSDDQKKTAVINERLAIIFKNLFIKDEDKDLKPLSALALYDEFSDLTPIGADGDIAIQKLAERMVSVDLLGRASNLLEHQIKYRLKGESAARVGARLASIRLLDQTPSFAIKALDETDMRGLPEDIEMERRLLRARAYSQLNKPDEAIKTLSGLNSEIAHRLNVDINWKASRWKEAAKAITPLLDYLLKKNNFLSESGAVQYLDEETSTLVLNQAVAYILDGDLGSVRMLYQKYASAMEDTKNASLFRLITREPKAGQLADLDTLNAHVAEVDLFKNFLDSYRTNLKPSGEGS